MAKETKFESTNIEKSSEKEVTISYKKVVEENVQETFSIGDLKTKRESILKAISDTQTSKDARIAEHDRSIAALQAQIAHIDEVIAQALNLGVVEEKIEEQVKEK